MKKYQQSWSPGESGFLNSALGLSSADFLALITDSFIKPCYIIQKKRKMYNFNKADWPSLQSYCVNLSNSLLLRSTMKFSVIELWDLFKSSLHLGISQFIPSKFVKTTIPPLDEQRVSQTFKKEE